MMLLSDYVKTQLDKQIAESSLYEFSKQAWPHSEGSTPFVDNWHIHAICEHLEAAYRRDIRNLLINVPPRTSETALISIFFPAWVWLQNPEEKFLYTSNAHDLSLEHSVKCRRVIEGEWYQGNWGDQIKLQRDQNAKSYFENTRSGSRRSTSVNSTPVGKNATFLVCDDPNSIEGAESESTRANILRWLWQEWYFRLNDVKKDVRIVVQQRNHANDVSGAILESDLSSNWTKLILPMEFEGDRKCTTVILPSTKDQAWQDPRTIEGELLCSERFGEKEIKQYKAALGSYGYAGQYQQRPSPKEGGIIKVEYFKHWKYSTPPDLIMRIQSWDTALTAKEESSYSACTTWGLFQDEYQNYHIILLGMWRGKLEYPELRNMAKRLYFDYKDNGKVKKENPTERKIEVFLVEDKSSGSPLIQDLRRANIYAHAFVPNPKKHGDKIARVKLMMPTVESGVVWLPCQEGSFSTLLPFAQDFLENMRVFPKKDSMDVVDSMTQVLTWLKNRDYLKNISDTEYQFDPEPPKPRGMVYGG